MAQLKDSIVSGNLRVTDTTLTDTLQVTKIKAPTTSGGTTYGVGTNGQVLKSNGTSTYWGSDTSSDLRARQTLYSTNANHPLLMSNAQTSSTTENIDNYTYRNNSIFANPSTGSLYATFIYAGGDESQSTYPAGGYRVYDCRNVSVTPANGDKTANFYFHMTGTPDTSKWWSVMHVKGWIGAYSAWEVAGPAHNSDQRTTPLYVRTSNINSTWGSWRKIYDASNPPTASEVGALSTSTKYALSTSVGGNAILADGLAIKTLTAETLDTTTGSFVFKGDYLFGDTYDWVGLQVDGSNDAFQLIANSQLMFRQNDTTSKTSANWGEWRGCLLPSNVIGSGGITVTQNDLTVGSGETAMTYKGAVTVSHSNSITAQSSTVFKKFSYDANGHITGTSNVTASDLPSHTHSQYYDSTQSRTANTVLAAPNGSNGAATFRKLVAADLPDLNYVPNTQDGVNAAINLLSVGSSNPNMADYYVSQYASGGTTTTTYHRRSVGALWNTFKGYIISETTGSGNALTSVTVLNDGTYNRKLLFNKELTFALASHTHDSLHGVYSASEVPVTTLSDGQMKVFYNVNKSLTGNMPASNNANSIIQISKHPGNYDAQLGFSSDGNIYYRNCNDTPLSSSVLWKTILDSSNYTSYALSTSTTYAGSSTVGGAANSAVKLETARTINVGTGVTGTATSFDGSANITIPVTGIKEAYLTWGGKDFTQSFSPLDAALEPRLGANRLEMCAGTGIKIERTTDSGTSWTEVTTSSISNADRSALFSSVGRTVTVSATSTASMGTDAAKYMMRITLDTSIANVYTMLNKFIFNISTNGCANCYVKLRIRTAANVTAGNDTWLTWDVRNKTWSSSPAEADTRCPIGGWSGFNVINIAGGITTYGNNTSQYRNIQFIFGCTKNDSTSAGLAVINIQGYGGVAWNAPSNMARTGHLYSWTGTGAASFPSSITANGSLIASSASGDSPALIFKRGTLTDNLNDWKIYVSSGHLYFDQSTANASSETWTHKMYYHASNSNLYIGSSPVLHTGNTSFTQTLTSGTKIGSITIAGTATDIYAPTNTDTKVTSSANHYTPATASGSDKSASASGATAAWSIDVVKGVTLNTDGKGHVTGISVTSGKIPANPVPSNNVTGSGTSGYLAKWDGTNTITNGPQLGSSTTTFLRNDGSWATPTDTDEKVKVDLFTSTTQTDYMIAGATAAMATTAAHLVIDTADGVAGVRMRLQKGTTSAAGKAMLMLGNNIASGTAKNMQGSILMYASTTYYGTITEAALTDNRTWTMPDKTGTVALTSDIPSFSVTSSGTGPVVTGMSYSSGVLTYTKGRILSTAGGQWISGRDNAPVLANSSSSTANGFYPLAAVKTNTGAWSIGALGNGDSLAFSFSTDTNYSGGVNTTNNYYIGTDGAFTGTAAGLTTKTVTASTINTTPGSFVFGGTNIIGGINDWVGFQADAGNDRFQIIANSQLVFRQNDSTTIEGNWGPWLGCLTPNNVSGDSGITITNITTTIGTGTTAMTYDSGVKISHTNSITASTSEVFKKFSYDANGHITGTANVGASDIPALNYVKTAPSVNYNINQAGFYAVMANKNTDNPNIDLPTANQWWHVLSMSWAGTSSDLNYWIGQLAIPTYQNKLNGLYWRTNSASNTALSADDWKRIYCEEKLTPSTTTKTRNILHIYGSTVGNTASELVSGVKGVLSYGDAGPQINFSTAATIGSTQDSAIIWTDNDSAATGVSWHFVSNQSDWNVISKRFHARTSISIGTDLPNTDYTLYVNGTTFHGGDITFGAVSAHVSPVLNVYTRASSTYNTFVKWSNGSTWGTRGAEIGYHNTGGDSTNPGTICILPYQTETNPWDGQVGLFIKKDHVYIDGVELSKTDENVKQTATTTNANYEVLFSATADNTTRTEAARKNSNLKFNPSTGMLTTTTIKGGLYSYNPASDQTLSNAYPTYTVAYFVSAGAYGGSTGRTGNSGSTYWAHYLTFTHSDRDYRYLLRFPYWGPPQYQHTNDGGNKRWCSFITDEHAGNYSKYMGTGTAIDPITGAMNCTHRANKLAFLPAANITVQTSTDSGSTWTNLSVSDDLKRKIFSLPVRNSNINIGPSSGNTTTSMQTRIIIECDGRDAVLDRFMFEIGSGHQKIAIDVYAGTTISGLTKIATGDSSSTWAYEAVVTIDHNPDKYYRFSTSNYKYIAFVFRYTYVDSSYLTERGTINGISGYSGNYWGNNCNSNLAHFDHLYSWDIDQNALFPATVQGEKLAVKSGTYTTTIEKGATTADRTLVLPDTSGGIGIANILLNDPTNSINPVPVSGSLSDYDYFTIVIGMNGSNSDQSSSTIVPAVAGSHFFLFQILESVGSGGSMLFPAGIVITTTSSTISFSVGVNRGINIPSSGTATSIASARTAYIKMIIGHKS